MHCRSCTAHCPRAVRQCIAGDAWPTAPREGGSERREYHSPLPSGNAAVRRTISTAHSPQAACQCVTLPTALCPQQQCSRAHTVQCSAEHQAVRHHTEGTGGAARHAGCSGQMRPCVTARRRRQGSVGQVRECTGPAMPQHTYTQRAHNTHSPARLPVPVGRHPGLCLLVTAPSAHHNTTQHSTTQHSTAKQSKAHHSRERYGTARHSSAQYRTVHNGTARQGMAGTTSYGTGRHGTARYGTPPHHTIPHHATPHYTIQHHTTPHHTTPHHTTPHHTTPHHTTPHHTTPHHTTPHHTTPHHTTPHHTTPHHTTPHHITPHHTKLHRTTPYHTTPGVSLPTAPGQCGSFPQGFHCPLPLGSAAVYCRSSTGHRP